MYEKRVARGEGRDGDVEVTRASMYGGRRLKV